MRRWISYLILVALTALAARPFWSTEFLASYDGPLHLFRLLALDLTLKQGVVYPRTLLDLAYGYGYPIFDFYPPFAAYLGETLHLFGLDFAQAIQAAFTLSIGLALFGAYALSMELFAPFALPRGEGELVGVLAAVAYVFFPYFMVGLYSRGALAETLALAILPWLVWSLRCTLTRQTLVYALCASLCLALLFLTHSLTTVILAPLLVVYTLFELFRMADELRLKALSYAALSALLGTGLAAFYWLPFVAELPLVRMGRGLDILSDIFETNFLKPEALVQPSLLYEYGGPPVPLGLVPLALGALALLGALFAGARLKQRGTILFFGAVAILAALAITEPARDLWSVTSLSSMIQSVWRVELLIDLSLALVIGSLPLVLFALTKRIRENSRRFADAPSFLMIGLTAVVALCLIWTSTANLAPAEILFPREVFDRAHLARFEISGASPGTTTFGEYMPATMTAPDLVHARAPVTNKANTAPPSVRLIEQRGTQWMLAVTSLMPVSVPLRLFYFPDWQATIDGQPARVYSSTEMGLLTVDVPAGTHEVRLYTQDTPVRQVGAAISGVAALIVLALLVLAIRRRESGAWRPLLASMVPLIVLGLPALAALTAPAGPLQNTPLNISSGLDLLGLRVEDARLDAQVWHVPEARDDLHLRIYWRVRRSGQADNAFTWRLVDNAGQVWAQRTQLPRYGTALQRTWMFNEMIADDYDLPLTAQISPGTYSLQVSPGPNPDYATVGQIELEKGSRPTDGAELKFANPVNALFDNRIRLLGYTAAPVADPGRPYAVTLSWQAERDLLEDYTVSVQLLDPGGKLVAQRDSITGEGLNPTSLWLPGQATHERRQLDLPRELKPGTYTLLALMYHLSDMKRLTVVTQAGRASNDAVVLGPVQILGGAPNIFANLGLLFSSTP